MAGGQCPASLWLEQQICVMTCCVCFVAAHAVRICFVIILHARACRAGQACGQPGIQLGFSRLTPKGVVFFFLFSEQAKTEPCQVEGWWQRHHWWLHFGVPPWRQLQERANYQQHHVRHYAHQRPQAKRALHILPVSICTQTCSICKTSCWLSGCFQYLVQFCGTSAVVHRMSCSFKTGSRKHSAFPYTAFVYAAFLYLLWIIELWCLKCCCSTGIQWCLKYPDTFNMTKLNYIQQ